MTNPSSLRWRDIGDTTLAVFEHELRDSPMLADAERIYMAARPHSALFLAHSYVENRHNTTNILIAKDAYNPLSLRARYGEPINNGFAVYASWEDCIAAWKKRFDDPRLGYKDSVTLEEYLAIYAPSGDKHPVTGVDNADIEYLNAVKTLLERFESMEIVFGNVPHPVFVERLITNKHTGWSNLGQRTPRGVVLHRMWGTLWGTDNYFRDPTVAALTDYGVGTANVDGLANDGKIIRWTNPRGTISPWANGSVSAPYGDGLLFINRYGINAVNRDLVSIEISGKDESVSGAAFEAVAQLMAYYGDQYKILWKDFPYVRAEGDRSFVIWHQEFTIGTGKTCPFSVVMNLTDTLIARTREIMRSYQEVVVVEPETPFVFDPKSVWPTWNPDGPVGRRWEQEGRRTHSWGRPDSQLWNSAIPHDQGKLYLFTNGLLVRAYEENGVWKTEVL